MIYIDDHITFREAVLEVCDRPSWYPRMRALLTAELESEHEILTAVSKHVPLDFEDVIEVYLPQIDAYFYFVDTGMI